MKKYLLIIIIMQIFASILFSQESSNKSPEYIFTYDKENNFNIADTNAINEISITIERRGFPLVNRLVRFTSLNPDIFQFEIENIDNIKELEFSENEDKSYTNIFVVPTDEDGIARAKLNLIKSGNAIVLMHILYVGSTGNTNISYEEFAYINIKDNFFQSKILNVEDESLNKKSEKAQLFVAKSYVKNICEINVSSFDDVKRDPQKVRNILRSYSRNISTLASNSTILADINAEFQNISKNTYYNYINALKRLFVIEDVPAWSPSIRSKSSIRSSPKKEFIDPSIAVAALGLSPQSLMDDLNTFGFIFETLCIRDLRVYTSKKWGEISYYNDRNGLEADCVIHLENGDYALIEFKLGSDEIEKGAKNLLKLKNLLKEKNFKEPKFLAVITGGKYAYTTEDDVKVIPIGCLC